MSNNVTDHPLVEDFVKSISNEIIESKRERITVVTNNVLDPRGGYAKGYGIYPETAIEIAHQIIDKAKRVEKEIFLLTLINDWKLLKSLKEGPDIRRRYWVDPDFDYLNTLESKWHKHLLPGLGSGETVDREEPAGRASEQRLHNQFSHFQEDNTEAIEEASSNLELYCSAEVGCSIDKCASEIMMILRHLYRQSIGHVVFLLPSECHHPIETGLKMTKALSNLLMPGIKTPMIVDHHSLNSTQPERVEELFEPYLPKNRWKIRHVIGIDEG